MLSRTADNLYWTGRYMERAENMARILDVSQRLAVQRRKGEGRPSEWSAVLSLLDTRALYEATHGEITEEGVIDFLTLDASNPSSILSCVQRARENARALRATISVELWEALNTTWLTIRDMGDLQNPGLREFADWVKERSHLFRGVVHGTMLHNDAYAFNRLGTFLERADNTARLLDTKYHLLVETGSADAEGSASDTDPAANYYEWGAVLRSAGAFHAYHQVYHDVILPLHVAELLVLRRDMPRSLRFCFDEVTQQLGVLSEGRPLECERLAGEFTSRLRYGQIERIMASGLHGFLAEVQDRTALLSNQIAHDFMLMA